MTTTDHTVWARGATTSAAAPETAPPAPPTYYPPTTEGGQQPSPGGPRRKLPRWIGAAAVVVAIAGAGVGGWALRGTQAPAPAPAAPSASPTAAAVPAMTPDQAKTQACNAYATNGGQWSAAYKRWIGTLAPGWTWNDPAVKDSTTQFDTAANQAVANINALIAPSTPRDVGEAIRGYTAAVLAYSAGHGTASQDMMHAQERAIDDAAAAADTACGL